MDQITETPKTQITQSVERLTRGTSLTPSATDFVVEDGNVRFQVFNSTGREIFSSVRGTPASELAGMNDECLDSRMFELSASDLRHLVNAPKR
jgi:hypothetical protein